MEILHKLSNLFGGGHRRPPNGGKIDRRYVSEFDSFMNGFLEEHPEVTEDQRIGRSIYWDRKLDFDALKKLDEDSVQAEGYTYFGLPGHKAVKVPPPADGESPRAPEHG